MISQAVRLAILLWISSTTFGKTLPPCKCMVFGDPHFQTCDGMKFEFQGTCSYTMMSACGVTDNDHHLQRFNVVVQNSQMEGPRRTTSTHEIKINFGDTNIVMASHGGIKVDGIVIDQFPTNIPEKGILFDRIADEQINRLMTGFGLTVLIKLPVDGEKHRIRIKIHRRYRRKLCGLCGNYDGRSGNDLRTANGTNLKRLASYDRIAAFNELGRSYLVQDHEEEEPCEAVIPVMHAHMRIERHVEQQDLEVCASVPLSEIAKAERICDIKNTTNPVERIFRRCLKKVQSNPHDHLHYSEFKDGCVRAYCAGYDRSSRNALRMACDMIQMLGELCRVEQEKSEGWCEVLQCPANARMGCRKWEPYLERYSQFPYLMR